MEKKLIFLKLLISKIWLFYLNIKGRVSGIKCYYILQEVGLKGMKICVKDLQGSGSGHDPLTVSYAVIGGWSFIYYVLIFSVFLLTF